MMPMRQFRDKLAPIMDTTSDAILNRERKVRPLMRDEAPPDTGFGKGYPIMATPMNAAFMLLATLDAAHVDEITERTRRLWRAHFAEEQGKFCPVTGERTAGQALIGLIEQPVLRDKLARIDLVREFETVDLVWKDQTRSLFYPDANGRAHRKRVFEATQRGPVHTNSLGGEVFDKVAALLEQHQGRE